MNFRPPFFAAPHRVMFFAGALQTLLAMTFWAVDLGARHAGLYAPLVWPVPPMWLHAVLMIYGLFSFFIFGFLMTALPKWVAMGPLGQRQYVPAFLMLVGGWGLFYAGFLASAPLMPVGLALVAIGWGCGWWPLFAAVRSSISEHKAHAWTVLSALAVGGVGVLLYALALLGMEPALVQAAGEIGLWLFLVPVFFTVTYRMLPFFSGSVVRGYVEYRSMLPFWIVLVCCALHALAGVADMRGWLWPADLVGAATAFWLSWRWQIHKVFVSHLLAMHHLAHLWLGVALLLFSLQGAAETFAPGWGGRAPLHALTVGYFGSILLGMATRVTLGHSGRLISSDVWAWRLFWLFQGVVVLRLAGEWLVLAGAANLVWLSAIGWLLVFGMWSRVHLLMFVRPRPDGRPG